MKSTSVGNGWSRPISVVIALGVLSGCSGAGDQSTASGQFGTNSQALNASAPRLQSAWPALAKIHKIIGPSGETVLSVAQSLPSAACTLTDADIASSAENTQEIPSGALGNVAFSWIPVTPTAVPST
jgi:hypothetical protein